MTQFDSSEKVNFLKRNKHNREDKGKWSFEGKTQSIMTKK